MSERFDVVIGNPPYQNEAQGASTRAEPIYNKFMDAAYEIGHKAVLITPARFLFNAGQTPRTWNTKMLADKHLMVAHYEPNSDRLFPGTDIKGGIVVTYERIGVLIPDSIAPMRGVVNKLTKPVTQASESFSSLISSGGIYRYSKLAMNDCLSIISVQGKGTGSKITTSGFDKLNNVVFFDSKPEDDYDSIRLVGLAGGRREHRWIRRDYVNSPTSLDSWKVIIAKANGNGDFGETISSPFVGEPSIGHTDTFLSVGNFTTEAEATACLKYVKTKFTRALLGVLKVTQDNPVRVWKYVPLQDFTSESDIDWSKPVTDIDQQLYDKYNLNKEERDFIESHVKPME